MVVNKGTMNFYLTVEPHNVSLDGTRGIVADSIEQRDGFSRKQVGSQQGFYKDKGFYLFGVAPQGSRPEAHNGTVTVLLSTNVRLMGSE